MAISRFYQVDRKTPPRVVFTLKFVTALALLLLSFKAAAVEFPIVISEYFDDVKIDAFVNKADLKNLEQWTPFESPPRLSVGDALTAVEKYINSSTGYSGYSLIAIELKQLPQHELHWHYIVKVNAMLNDQQQPGFFVVLMNGKVLSAIEEPDSIK